MNSSSYQRGKWAEDWVEGYLRSQGWQIFQRNYRGQPDLGEIDLIAGWQGEIVFVEVKASGRRPPQEALRGRQIHRIRRAALGFLQGRGLPEDTPIRFDLFWLWGDRPHFEHLVNAF